MTAPLVSLSDFGTHDESACPELWDGCIGAWAPCLGNTGLYLHDWSRNGNRGQLANMDVPTDWVVSGGGVALDFDGINDYIYTNLPYVPTTNRFSVTSWFRLPSRFQWWGIAVAPRTVNLFGLLLSGATNFPLTMNWADLGYNVDTGLVVPLNTWCFGAGVVTPTSVTVYLMIAADGVLLSHTRTGTFSAYSLPGEWSIARDPIGRYWTGMIDDVRLYSRSLSSEEIRLLAARRGVSYERRRRRLIRASDAVTPVTGSLTVTLAGVSLSATGSVAVRGAAAIALDGVTLAATGSVAVRGALAVTLDGVSLSATASGGVEPTITSISGRDDTFLSVSGQDETLQSVSGRDDTFLSIQGSASMPVETTISIYRGDDCTLEMTLSGSGSISGDTFTLALEVDPAGATVLQKDATVYDAPNRKVRVSLTRAETSALSLSKAYTWAIARTNSGRYATLARGRLVVLEEVSPLP